MGMKQENSMPAELTWRALLALQELAETGSTTVSGLEKFVEINFLIEQTGQLTKSKNGLKVQKESFNDFFKKKYSEKISAIKIFLESYDISSPQHLSIKHIESLQKIADEKEEILASDDVSLKELSSLYFTNSKEVKEVDSVYQCILKILPGIEFAKSEQYVKILFCKSDKPERILLCENDNQLHKNPKQTTEIWVLGGKNTAKIKNIPLPDLPMHYLCDWDQDGMETYLNLKTHIPQLQLVLPPHSAAIAKDIEQTAHKSLWKKSFDFAKFNQEESEILRFLIEKNMWIEEESIDILAFENQNS
jgi:hypothetical protein